jgi:hypothetical protein
MKSRRIFDRFSKNLKNVREKHGIVIYNHENGQNYPQGYLCPVTLDFFEDPYHEQLSEEHVPQKSIGGKVICLTRKNWNLGFNEIDNHVAERAKELSYFKQSGKSRALAYVNGKFKSEMTVELSSENPKLSFIGGGFKESNPEFMKLMTSHENKEEFKVRMKPKGTLTRNTRLGYLKNAYLIAFATFGYSLIFGNKGSIELFRTIRQQLREPTEKIFGDLPFVYEVKNESDLEGVYLTKVKGVETISVFFQLATDDISRAGVTFPPLDLPHDEVKKWSIYEEDADFYKLKDNADFASFGSFSKLNQTRYNEFEYDNTNY